MNYLLTIITFLFCTSSFAIDLNEVNAALQSADGVELEVHGADQDNLLYSVVYRSTKNFFDYAMFPIVADSDSPDADKIKTILTQLVRHDRVRVKGQFNPLVEGPQRHIAATSLVITKKFSYGQEELNSYKHQTVLPKALENKTEAVFKVHAMILSENEKVPTMMVEYGDANIPVYTKNIEAVKNLYRNDKVKLKFKIMKNPGAPVHLKVGSEPDAVTLLQSVKDYHGQDLEKCGPLVLFPQNDLVNGNVFAIKQDIGDNLFMTFTLLNFDPVIFKSIRARLQENWDPKKDLAVRERNYLTNYNITACAKGKGNEIDPSQANPQILLDSADQLSFK